MTTQTEALKIARIALGVQLDALLGKAGHLHNDDRRRYAENGIKAIDEALAQPEQEPVARIVKQGATVKLEWVNADSAHNAKVGNLYTTPSQRTWVGLTDEEINEWTPEIHAVIQAIETKLKEKNT